MGIVKCRVYSRGKTVGKTVVLALVFCGVFGLCVGWTAYGDGFMYNELSEEQKRVIEQKGTEAPFSGSFNKHYQAGVYMCARCGAGLFVSESKFDSGCGWPAFDDEVAGAVKRVPDSDGMRTEIVCARCNAHLGHVFSGEGFTPKNVRHCVNSLSLGFVPAAHIEKAVFAGGCFWGVEHLLKRIPGVLYTSCGYTGGFVENPSYRQVCSGRTGHVEAVEVWFDRTRVSFRQVLELFFEIHDFEQANGQGPDIGPQYLSVIFYDGAEQKQHALQVLEWLRGKGYKPATVLREKTTFFEAEDYHQDYYEKQGSTPYCHFRRSIF